MGGLAQVCIFNLIASSLHFAPRLKSPLTPLFALDLFFFFNMTRISPACVLSRRHKPCSRQPCVLTVDFESELRINLILPALFSFYFEKRLQKVA